MPELPEVETIKRGLEKVLKGLSISAVDVREGKLFQGNPKDIMEAKIERISRRGKMLIFELNNDKSLLIHLKLTGQLIYQSGKNGHIELGGHPERAYEQPLPHRHTHIIFAFSDGSKLYFNDLRKFGYVKVNSKSNPPTGGQSSKLFGDFGPEPLDEKLSVEYLIERAGKRKITVYQFLMDQKVVAGIGNIYVSEILCEAGILPTRTVDKISKKEWQKIVKTIKLVLGQGIEAGGSTINTFRNINGGRGDYLERYGRVYGKEKCPRGHFVTKKKIGGRTSHYCEKCQK